MFIYLGDNDSVFEAALREDSSVRAYYESLPGMLRERCVQLGCIAHRRSAHISIC